MHFTERKSVLRGKTLAFFSLSIKAKLLISREESKGTIVLR